MSTEVSQEVQRAMDKAKLKMMASPDTAFFTTVAFSMRHMWDDTIPTACTNGKWIKYSPDFFMGLSEPERVGLILHETLHVVFMHMARLNGRDMYKWNVATDYVINQLIVDRGFTIPAGGLLDPQYRDMSSEQVYDLLPTQDPEETEVHFEQSEDETPQETEQRLGDVLIQASIQSRAAGDKPGTIPGEIQFYIDNLLDPKLPTAQILRRHLHAMGKNDYTWRKPNRRFFPRHHLPSRWSEKLGHIAIAVDASGSVSDEEFKAFIGEVGGIIKQMRPEKISLITFDTSIRQVDTVKSLNDLVQIEFTGRGGTLIEPVQDWVEANKPKVILVFTDGGFNQDADYKSQTPYVWLIHNNPGWKALQGKAIHYTLES